MLSPTMEAGKIIEWNFKEGDEIIVGDYLCEVETDKATVGFEILDDCYLAKIILPEGSSNIPLGEHIAIVVEDEDDIAAFADWTADDAGATEEVAPEAEPEVVEEEGGLTEDDLPEMAESRSQFLAPEPEPGMMQSEDSFNPDDFKAEDDDMIMDLSGGWPNGAP